VAHAYEFATGQRFCSGDFEGGKTGVVKVLRKLGFTIQAMREERENACPHVPMRPESKFRCRVCASVLHPWPAADANGRIEGRQIDVVSRGAMRA
jgi:hypothetical protein